MHVNLDHKAGTYDTRQTVDWQASQAVDFVMFTVNGLMPTLSEYVAYDTLSPPNPFIAVTQDGRGNVVYDGGFPKFYNIYAPAAGTPFASLSGAFKYLYNALNFVSNKAKVNAGNRNVLILGDAIAAENYPVKSGAPTGFYTSFVNLFATAGYNPVFKDRADYSGTLNPTFAELDQYCAVLHMSSDYATATGRFTAGGVAAMVAYREAGNGVILITDHGPDIPDVNTAANGSYGAFFRTANQLVAEYGAYFSGVFDRVPVNVGFLRNTYGNHFLYNGMADSEYIHAGASESRVFIANYPRYKPNELPKLELENGCYNIQILTRLKNGTVEIQRQTICIDRTGNGRNKIRKLYVRETSTSPWVVNFAKGGWGVYKQMQLIRMTPANTVMWDAKLKEWVGVK
jgi:hypothetical protein